MNYQTKYQIFELVYGGMDNAVFSRGLRYIPRGTVLEYNSRPYTVLYSWAWTVMHGKPIYMAELDPWEESKEE